MTSDRHALAGGAARSNNLEPVVIEVPTEATPTLVVVDPNAPAPKPTPTPTVRPPQAPLARIALTGVKVLMVPQVFRYEEVPAGASEEETFASARTTSASQSGSVIVLDVPHSLMEIMPGVQINVATLLAALDKFGAMTLALEPAEGTEAGRGCRRSILGALYQSMQEEGSQPGTTPSSGQP